MITIQLKSGLNLFPLAGVYAQPRGTAGGTVNGTYHSLNITTTTLTLSYSDYLFDLRDLFGAPDFVVENLNPSIASITNWPLVERITDGYAQIRLTYGDVSSTRRLDFRISGGSSSVTVTGFVSGTFGAYSWGKIEPLLIAGGDANLLSGGVDLGTFSGSAGKHLWDFGSATYNTACWADVYDFSGVSHKSSLGGNSQTAGTNITAWHKIFANHFAPPVGTVMTDIAPDGTKHARTIVAYNTGAQMGGFNSSLVVWDTAVALMSAAAHEDVAVYPIVGPWFYETVGSGYLESWVGLKIDQERNVQLCGRTDTTPIPLELASGVYNGVTFTNVLYAHPMDWQFDYKPPSFLSAYSSRYGANVTGDSGSPRFFPLVAPAMAFVGTVTWPNGGGPYPNEAVINACIASANTNGGRIATDVVTVAPDPS